MNKGEPLVVELQLVQASLLNTVADAQHVDTTALRKCAVSTTVNDIKYGTLKIQDENHQACVIFFCFDVVGQQGGRAERIKELDILLRLVPGKATEAEKAAVTGQISNLSGPPSLEIRHREPSRAQGSAIRHTVSTQAGLGGQAGFQYAGVNAGYSVTKSRELHSSSSLESHLVNVQAVNFRLKENSELEDGVPGQFQCALILRTDHVPFSIGVEFAATMGNFWRRKAAARLMVGESLLRHKQLASIADEPSSLSRMESDDFLEWVKSKTTNFWIAQ